MKLEFEPQSHKKKKKRGRPHSILAPMTSFAFLCKKIFPRNHPLPSLFIEFIFLSLEAPDYLLSFPLKGYISSFCIALTKYLLLVLYEEKSFV
jgi:hypothetical protein